MNFVMNNSTGIGSSIKIQPRAVEKQTREKDINPAFLEKIRAFEEKTTAKELKQAEEQKTLVNKEAGVEVKNGKQNMIFVFFEINITKAPCLTPGHTPVLNSKENNFIDSLKVVLNESLEELRTLLFQNNSSSSNDGKLNNPGEEYIPFENSPTFNPNDVSQGFNSVQNTFLAPLTKSPFSKILNFFDIFASFQRELIKNLSDDDLHTLYGQPEGQKLLDFAGEEIREDLEHRENFSNTNSQDIGVKADIPKVIDVDSFMAKHINFARQVKLSLKNPGEVKLPAYPVFFS
ncbi:hypothetical protein ACFL35_07380 [Candidatus Riflebacteria bacterium]